jgi:hypothetical protein
MNEPLLNQFKYQSIEDILSILNDKQKMAASLKDAEQFVRLRMEFNSRNSQLISKIPPLTTP